MDMTVQDLESVTDLARQLGYPNSQAEIRSRFLEIQNQGQYALFVAKSETEQVLGWLQVNVEPISLVVGPRAEIAALVVDEKCRGQNIGKALLRYAEKWALEKKISLVRLRSNLKRHDAHRFYQREGYEISKVSNVFTKNIGG